MKSVDNIQDLYGVNYSKHALNFLAACATKLWMCLKRSKGENPIKITRAERVHNDVNLRNLTTDVVNCKQVNKTLIPAANPS